MVDVVVSGAQVRAELGQRLRDLFPAVSAVVPEQAVEAAFEQAVEAAPQPAERGQAPRRLLINGIGRRGRDMWRARRGRQAGGRRGGVEPSGQPSPL